LLTPIPNADDRLRELLEERADAMLATRPHRNTFLEQIRCHIGNYLGQGDLTVEKVAKKMGMSERTLKRRLKNVGQSYRHILDDVRRIKALQLAQNPTQNVTSIAYGVGFSNTTILARAFRRWTGVTPTEYLRRIHNRV